MASQEKVPFPARTPMTTGIPGYLSIPPQELGRGTPVRVEIVGEIGDVARHFAQALFDEIKRKPDVTMVLPVGPVDQFPLLAKMINQARLDCREMAIINMDEYLSGDQWVSIDHPLSFRGYMNRKFYDLLDPHLAPRAENRIFPDPMEPSQCSGSSMRGAVWTSATGVSASTATSPSTSLLNRVSRSIPRSSLRARPGCSSSRERRSPSTAIQSAARCRSSPTGR